ncbi:MAG TPA: GDSL-type esterase/lipase family protein [Acidimicrobiia bacterium]
MNKRSGHARGKPSVLALCAAALALALAAMTMGTAPARAATPAPTYYLALGDSLASGGGTPKGHAYVDDVYAREAQGIPGLQFENLSCGGDSTTRMIHGGLCTNYTTGNQLGDAEAFLAAHRGQISFVTIDVGGDDILGCAINKVTIDPACVTRALNAVKTNLPIILQGLFNAAGHHLHTVGMTYYDPILAAWVTGAPFFPGTNNQALAIQSFSLLQQLNSELRTIYDTFNVRIAPVQKLFRSGDFQLTGTWQGQTVPENVALVCAWTHMCGTGPGEPNVHTTEGGHQLLALKYERQLAHWTNLPPLLTP